MALLTGVCHFSRRKTVQLLSDLPGVRVSLGALSAAESRVSETWVRVYQADVKHADGTSWLQSNVALSLWTLATAAATVFTIVKNSSKKTLQPLCGALHGILVSDRSRALTPASCASQLDSTRLMRSELPILIERATLLTSRPPDSNAWQNYRSGKLPRPVFGTEP